MRKYTLNIETGVIHLYKIRPYDPMHCDSEDARCRHGTRSNHVVRTEKAFRFCNQSPACWNYVRLGRHRSPLYAGITARTLCNEEEVAVIRYCGNCFHGYREQLDALLQVSSNFSGEDMDFLLEVLS